MTATTHSRMTEFAGLVPARGSEPIAANTLILRHTMVALDGDGNAIQSYTGADNTHDFNAIGMAASTVDNRTTAPSGGAAGAETIDIEYGVFGWAFTGTAPKSGGVVFAVDNQTVSLDSDSGKRGIAGYCSRCTDTVCYTLMGPTIVGQIVLAASVAADVVTAQAAVDALEVDALSTKAVIDIPLTSFRVAASGAAVAAFSNGVSDGFALVDSEAFGLRFNDDTTAQLATSVYLPADLDDTADVVLHFLGFRVGAANATAALTVKAFAQTVGAAHTATSDVGGDTSTFAAATTVVSEETLTIAAANVPASPANLTLTIVPNAALADDDLVITAAWLEYTRKLRTA